jgi:glycosyltransferase involved in cell wall biosynthesis
MPFWFCLLLARLKLKRYKVAVTCHEIFIDLDWKSAKYWPVGVSQRIIAYTIGTLADKIIVSIARTKHQLGVLGSKITRIPIGSNIIPVDVPPFRLFELKRKYAPEGEFLFVSFGIRDQEAAVRVIADLVKEGLPVKLLLLGKLSGAAIQKINLQIGDLGLENRVIVTGYLHSDQLFEVLSCGDAFILLEEKRGGLTTKSGSLAAAYAAGLPVIGTAGHMTDDFFRNGENALLAQEGDYKATLTNARRIVQDEALRMRLKAGTAETYDTRLSWEKIAESYQAVLA